MATNISGIVFQSLANTSAVNLVNGDTLNLFSTGLVVASGTGDSRGILAAGSNTLNIAGEVLSLMDIGIFAAAGGNVFNLAAGATVFGRDGGIQAAAAGNVVTNAGNIGSLGNAVQFDGGSITLSNSGNIRSIAANAIEINGGSSNITNAGRIESEGAGGAALEISVGDGNTVINTGFIRGMEAIDFDGAGGVNSVFNAGTLIGFASDGLNGSNGLGDNVINNGTIQGALFAVNLLGGNDVYDGRNGTIVGGASGGVNGGAGDDIIYGGAGGENLQGGTNNDQIFGGGGADVILGGDGIDLILGGAGGDVIRGGLGVDLYGFNVGDNGDLIQNFNEGGVRDGFDLRGYFNETGFTGNNPRAVGILQVLQNGADTDVYLHGAFAIRIQGVVAAAVDDSYFLFQ